MKGSLINWGGLINWKGIGGLVEVAWGGVEGSLRGWGSLWVP